MVSGENVRLYEGMRHKYPLLVYYDLKCRKRHSVLRLPSPLHNFPQSCPNNVSRLPSISSAVLTKYPQKEGNDLALPFYLW